MNKKLKIGLLTLLVAFVAGAVFLVAQPVSADAYGLQATANAAKLVRSDTPAQVIGRVIGAALSLVGVLFFILTIYAGITWMMARGNAEQSKKALNTIIAAVIGLVIVFASYAITNFILSSIGDGGGGGAASSGPTSEVDTSGCDEKEGDWSCQSIDSCGLTFVEGEDSVDQKRAVCDATSATCETGLCLGSSNSTVCCNPG